MNPPIECTLERRALFLAGAARKGTMTEGTAEAGVSMHTARRWLEDPALAAEFTAISDAAVRAAMERDGFVPRDGGKPQGHRDTEGKEGGSKEQGAGSEEQEAGKKKGEERAGGRRFDGRRFKRPRTTCKRTRKNVGILAEGLRATGSVTAACETLGLSVSAFYRWREIEWIDGQFSAALAEFEAGGAGSMQREDGSRRPGEEALLGDAWPGRPGRDGPEKMWAAMEAAPESEAAGSLGVSLTTLRQSPGEFFRRVLGWKAWIKQLEIAEAVRDAIGEEAGSGGPEGEGREGPPHSNSLPPAGTLGERGSEAPAGTPGERGSESGTPGWSQALPGEGKDQALAAEGLKRVAVRSGNGVGKTAIAARIMLWVLRCWPGSVVISTAPTQRQVEQVLWREARAAYHKAKVGLGGRFLRGQARWEIGPQRVALGISPDKNGPEKFQGFHAGLIVFIVDEASAVPEEHWEAMKGSALAGNAVILAIGNPTRTQGEFFDAFHGKAELWRTMAISAFDTPNFMGGEGTNTERPSRGASGQRGVDYTDGGTQISQKGEARSKKREAGEREEAKAGRRSRIPGLVLPERVEQMRKDWGEGSSMWIVRVLGQFPKDSSAALVQLEWLEQALHVPFVDGPHALGVDVARSGEDETVIMHLQGKRLVKTETWRGQDTMRTAGKVREYADTYRGISIAIDDGGVGGGVVDRLREQGVAVRAVKFGASPDGRLAVNFRNKMSEIYWVLREELREKRLALPNTPKLWAQLTQVEWELESDKAIRVHKRGLADQGPSPDLADALALAVEARNRAERSVGIFF